MTALIAAQSCALVACPNPFDLASRVFARVPAGQSLAEMIGPDASHSLAIEINGHEVPRELWAHTRPKAGRTVHVTSYPQGGNGGKWARLVLMVIVMYFAPYLSGYAQTGVWGATATGLGGSLMTAGIMMVGSLAVTPMIGHAREVAA